MSRTMIRAANPEIAEAIELECRVHIHSAGALVKEAVAMHCDGDLDQCRVALSVAISHLQDALRRCGQSAKHEQ